MSREDRGAQEDTWGTDGRQSSIGMKRRARNVVVSEIGPDLQRGAQCKTCKTQCGEFLR